MTTTGVFMDEVADDSVVGAAGMISVLGATLERRFLCSVSCSC